MSTTEPRAIPMRPELALAQIGALHKPTEEEDTK